MRAAAVAIVLLVSPLAQATASYGAWVLSYGFESHADGVVALIDERVTDRSGGDKSVNLGGVVMFLGGHKGLFSGGWRLALQTWSDTRSSQQVLEINALNFSLGPSFPILLHHVHPLLNARVALDLGVAVPIYIGRGDVNATVAFPVRLVAQVVFGRFIGHLALGRSFSLANMLWREEISQAWVGEAGLGITF